MANDLSAAHEALEKAFCFDAPTHEIKIGPDLYLDLPEGYRYALIKQDGHTLYGPTADFLALRILFEDDPTPYESVFSAPFNFTAIGPLKKLDIVSGYDAPGVPDIALCNEAINTRRKAGIKREDIKAIRRDHDFYVEYRREATQGNNGKFYHYYITFVAKGTLYTGQAFFNKKTIHGVPVLAKDRDEIVRKFIHMFKTESSENRKGESVSPGALAERQKITDRISDDTSSMGNLAGLAAVMAAPLDKVQQTHPTAETDTSACGEDSRSSEEQPRKTDMIGEAPCDSHPLTAHEALEKAFCFDASAHEIKIGPDLCFDLPEGYRYALIKQDGPTPEFQAFRVLFQDDPTPCESVFTAPFSFTAIGPLTKLNIESGYDADAALDGVPIPTRMQPGDIQTIRREDDFYAEYRLEEMGSKSEAVFRYFVTVVAKGQLYAAQLFFNSENIHGVPVSAKDRDEIVCRFIRMFRTESPENRESEPVSPEAPDECRKIADSISDESSPMEQFADPEPVTTRIDASVCEEDSRFPEEHPKKAVMTGDTPRSRRKVIFTDPESDALQTYSTLDEICAFYDKKVDDDTVIHLCVGEKVRIEGKNPYSIPLNKKVVRFFENRTHLFILFEDGTIKVPEIWHPKYEVKMWAEVARQVETFTDVQSFAILESEFRGMDRPAAPSVIIIQRDGTVSVVKGKESFENHKKLIEQIEGSTGVRDVFRYRRSSIVMILLDGTVRSYGKPLCIPKIKNCISAKLLTGSRRNFMLQTEDASYVVSEYNGVVHKLKGIKKAVSTSWNTYMLTDDLRFFELSWAEDDKTYKGFNNESTITDFWINKSAGFDEASVVVLYEDGYALKLAKSDMITAENAIVGHKYESGTLSFDIAEDKNNGGTAKVKRKPGASLELVRALSLQTMEMIYRRLGLDESRIIYQGESNIFSLHISRFDYTRVIEDPDFKRYAAATTDLARAALEEMAKVPKDENIYYSIGEAAIMLSWKDVVSVVELGHMLNRYKVPSLYMELGVSVSQDIPGYAFELDNDCTQFHVDTKKHTSIRNVIGACDYGRLFRNTESKQDRITLLGLLLADEARKFYPDCDWLPLRKEVPKSGEYTLDPFYKDLAEQFILWHQKNHHRFGAGFFKNKTAIEWIDDFLLSYFPPKYPDSTIQNCIFIDDGMAECCHFALDRMYGVSESEQ